MGRKQVGLKAEDLRRLVNQLLREHLGHVGHVSLDSDRDRVRYGHISLDCFPSLRTINMYPMVFVKRTSSRLQSTTLGASPPLILGFHPS